MSVTIHCVDGPLKGLGFTLALDFEEAAAGRADEAVRLFVSNEGTLHADDPGPDDDTILSTGYYEWTGEVDRGAMLLKWNDRWAQISRGGN